MDNQTSQNNPQNNSQNSQGSQPSGAQSFFDDAARLFDKGISKARTVVSETSIEQGSFV